MFGRAPASRRQTLLSILDDATKHLLYTQLWPAETMAAVMTALATVLRTHGLPAALYTDRAGWAFHTPTAGGPIARDHLTHVGRAVARRCGLRRALRWPMPRLKLSPATGAHKPRWIA